MISFEPLKILLLKKGITREELAKVSGVSRTTLDNMFRNRSVTLESIEKLCNYFQCTMQDIVYITFNEEEKENKND